MLETEVDKAVLITLGPLNLYTVLAACGRLSNFTYIGHSIHETSQWGRRVLGFGNIGCGQVDHGAVSQKAQVSVKVEVRVLG
jgi:hypothetical protein